MRQIILPTVLLAAALALTGCSASSGAASLRGDADSGKVAAPAQDSSGGSDATLTNAAAREVVMSGTMVIKSTSPVKTSDEAVAIVEEAGGRVDGRDQVTATRHSGGHASLQLRIPVAKLNDALVKLKKLGTVESVNISAKDVTTEGQDMDARIKALSTSVDRLLELEARAKATDVLIQLETAISERQGQLDSLVAQRRTLSDQVAMSTINLTVVSPADVPATAPTTPGDALSAGFATFSAFFTGVFLVLTFLLPWLVLFALIGVALLYFLRRRRARAGAVDAAVAPAAPLA